MRRWEIVFSGRVQGVGFRYRVHQISAEWPVTGFVQNMEDGTVRLVAEGMPQDLASFLSSIEDKLSDFIRKIVKNDYPSRGEFTSFGIRRD
jgi:acylphosphatase